MLIRISHKKEGIEHYLETGQKDGRTKSREELDNRVYLSGDLDSFAATVQYTRNEKEWENHYWHITASFAVADNELDDDTLKAINDEMMSYYFCGYDTSKVIHACEAHRPRYQTTIDADTNKKRQRLLHFHNAISKYDVVTGNQLRMIPYNHEADKAFQSYLCKKYNLEDPANYQRKNKISAKEILSRHKGDLNISKQTKVADYRKLFSNILSDAVSIDHAKEILKETGLVSDIQFKEQKSGTKYLKVKLNDIDSKSINLRGKGFESLEELYYSKQELSQRIDAGKFKPAIEKSLEDYKATFERHKKWFLEQQQERAPKDVIDYTKTTQKYEDYYKKYTREQRQYFVIYKTNIKLEAIRGYKIFSKKNERHLVNNDTGVKIYDKPNKILLEIPDDKDKMKSAVSLALQIAIDKGWNLSSMKITGSFEFEEETKRQINQLLALRNKDEMKLSDSLDNSKPKQERTNNDDVKATPEKATPVRLNSVNSALKKVAEENSRQQNKNNIEKIKKELPASIVLDIAKTKFGVLSEFYEVTSDNKINDTRTKAKPKSVVDFLSKHCNMPFNEAMTLLNYQYQNHLQNTKAQRMDVSICTGNQFTGANGWQKVQPKTFRDMETFVKSYNYAAFTELSEDHRKANNIKALGNCAIFDIDNDPDQPNLTIEQAKELLKDFTFMIVTSKSHQIVKNVGKENELPAVDRYRIIVPMTKSFECDKEKYRLSMIKMANEIGLLRYCDQKALKDIARQYYASPQNADTIINNTKKAFDNSSIIDFAITETKRIADEKERIKESLSQSIDVQNSQSNNAKNDSPFCIDINLMNRLPLDVIYESMTGRKLEQDGSYLKGKGITDGTSESRQSFTIFKSNDDWIWHDFKTQESGNVVTFMRAFGLDIFKASDKLSEMFNVNLKTVNVDYYKKVIEESLSLSKNDAELRDNIKTRTGARFVSVDKDDVKIADKTFTYQELDITYKSIVSKLIANRNGDDLSLK